MVATHKTKRAFLIVAGVTAIGAGATGLVNCSGSGEGPTGTPPSGGQSANAEDTGTVGLALKLPGGTQLNSVTYDLVTSGGTPVTLPGEPNPGAVDVSNSAGVAFQLGGVPVGTGDSISLTASIAGGGTCQGIASGITIAAGRTTSVTVQMVCSSSQDAGNLFVTANASLCPTWTSFSTSNSEVFVGASLVLTATATGSNPANLGYTWTMSNPIGAFGSATAGVGAPGQDEAAGPSDAMQFLCTAPGTTTVTVAVDDGSDAGACVTSESTTTTTVTCDAFPNNQVVSSWVELGGPNGSNGLDGNVAIARAITAATPTGGTNPCPAITINGAAPVQMNLRAGATTSLPARSGVVTPVKPSLFPVSACEYVLPANATSAVVAGQSLPLPKANPTKVVVIGDTGCRLEVGNGFQSCNDGDPNGTDTPWPFAEIASLAAAQNPDLVLHVGDYQYRESACPGGMFNCAGSPWGYGWDTWQADLFAPAAPLLAAAPWIMTRGNHEMCNRAGQGWYRFLDTNAYDTTDVHTCDSAANDTAGNGGNFNNPFLVNINASTQVVVFDTANAKPSSGVATGTTSAWYETYQSELETAGSLVGAAPLPFNLWSNHHAIFGYATGASPTSAIPLFPPVMNAVFPGTYFPPPINLALHGHTHDYQALNFAPETLADGGAFQPTATLVSGNAGDLLDTTLPYPLTGAAVSAVSNPTAVSVATVGGVQQFATADFFGYMVLEFNAGPPATWVSTEYRPDNTVRDVCTIQTSGQMSCASWGTVPADDAGVP
ncbi:MAG TPA: metallophosphoesterase [Polyangiaceae bacterium]|nr:metallophosphoesterase [Polyangiaceae bacterium]